MIQDLARKDVLIICNNKYKIISLITCLLAKNILDLRIILDFFSPIFLNSPPSKMIKVYVTSSFTIKLECFNSNYKLPPEIPSPYGGFDPCRRLLVYT